MKPRSITDILNKSHALSVVKDKPRIAYDAVAYLNTSSIAAGLVDHREIDPLSIKFAFENQSRTTQQAALDRMDRGTLAHLMLLQPERLATDVVVWPAGKNRTRAKEGKEPTDFDKATEVCAREGKLLICEEDHEAVAAAVKEFQWQPRLRELLTNLDAEVAMFSTECGFYVKGLVDAVRRDYTETVDGPRRLIIDLKTTEAGVSSRAIEYTIRSFRNREKMAAYRRWYARESHVKPSEFKCINIFLSMVKPYAIRVVDIPTTSLDWGEKRIVAACEEVRKCLDKNEWPMLVGSGEAMVETWEEEEVQII